MSQPTTFSNSHLTSQSNMKSTIAILYKKPLDHVVMFTDNELF